MSLRKIRAVFLCSLVLAALFIITMQHVQVANAGNGQARVYILCLSGVGGSAVSNPSDVAAGAIYALRARERFQVPLAHPMNGKIPPFYDVSYLVVSDWSTYETIVKSCRDVVIVNCHGEILPIPSDYVNNRTGWVDEIADAMLNRAVTWVHVGGYPFSPIWNEGDSNAQLWSPSYDLGFKNLTSHINLPNAECQPQGQPTDVISITQMCQNSLAISWPDIGNAVNIQQGYPLSASDFGNLCVLNIHGSTNYYTSAVISFVKPGLTLDPAVRSGSGMFVHIGGLLTYTAGMTQTDSDYWRGYIGCAAAVNSEMQVFDVSGMSASTSWSNYTIYTVPSISSITYLPSNRGDICISFFVYGRADALSAGYQPLFDHVHIETEPVDPSCHVWLRQDLSRSGVNTTGLTLTGLNGGGSQPIVSTLVFAGDVAGLVFEPVGAVVLGLSAGMLFDEWASAQLGGYQHGVTAPDSYVCTDYTPMLNCTTDSNGVKHWDFESVITIDLIADLTQLSQWRVIPLRYCISLLPANVVAVWCAGQLPVAVFNNYKPYNPSGGYSCTTFFGGWKVG